MYRTVVDANTDRYRTELPAADPRPFAPTNAMLSRVAPDVTVTGDDNDTGSLAAHPFADSPHPAVDLTAVVSIGNQRPEPVR